jgi:hypothetical protein
MADASSSPQRITWLDQISLPALVLAADGSAVAANREWAAVSPAAVDGEGWLEAVDPAFRPELRATLHLASTTGAAGSADCPVTGPGGGRWSRWWWQPFPRGGLVVCVAVLQHGPAEGLLPTMDDPSDPVAQGHIRSARPTGIDADLAAATLRRIFAAGLALQSAATKVPEPAASLVLRILDDLDRLVEAIHSLAVKSRARLTIARPDER